MNLTIFNQPAKKGSILFLTLFVLLIIAENYILFYYSVNLGQQWLNAICYFISSLCIGFLILSYYKGKVVEKVLQQPKIPIKIIVLGLSLLTIAIFAFIDRNLFEQIAIYHKQSDIIPTVQVLVKRLFSGEVVYRPIEDFGYYLPVTYLPLQWIVYTPAEYFGFDYRWIAFFIWVTGSVWLLIRVLQTQNLILKLLIPAFLFGIYGLILYKQEGIVSNTIETMVAGYYIIFIISMNQKNAILQGIGITLCLLSRFSLVIWLPLWAFVLFVSNNRKSMWITMSTTAILVLLIYVIPFLSKDWNSFFSAYKYYSHAALGEWSSINYTIMKPTQLNVGTGIAFLFAEIYKGDLALGLKLLQRTGMVFYFITIILLGIWYWKNKKNIHMNIFLLASFKIYLSVFLFFIQVPYVYLMVVANFISVAIFAELLRYRVVLSKNNQKLTE